jgi:pimeloyl-ACP methyl ester carboxylesterase
MKSPPNSNGEPVLIFSQADKPAVPRMRITLEYSRVIDPPLIECGKQLIHPGRCAMKRLALALVAVSLVTRLPAEGKRPDESQKPLVLASQGSFFVGGESKSISVPGRGPGTAATTGEITVNQMYVQYQAPPGAAQRVPVVMVHGCCLSSKTWETTPDGRMGWNEYFVRKGRSVYLADQVSRARSGFDPTAFNAVRSGERPASDLPNILDATHQTAWAIFRFGPRFNEPFADEQFPVEAVGELYKQMIPDLNSTLPSANPTWTNMAALAVQLHGAVLMGHSESGFFPEQSALVDPSGIRANISIEMPCGDLSDQQISVLAKIPTLVIFGDHLADVPGIWQSAFDGCQKFVDRVKAAGGDAEMMYLPKLGMKGNSHMLMQDKNNLAIADLILAWLNKHVDSKTAARAK